MTVTLTAAEHAEVLRQMPGPIYLTVEGDRRGKVSTKLNYVRTLGYALSAEFDWYPPSRFMEATGSCPCGTTNFDLAVIHESRWDDARHEVAWFDPDCPDCLDGRKRVELRVTCPSCDGIGTVRDNYLHVTRGQMTIENVCSRCEGFGAVLFAHATIEVLPVCEADCVPVSPIPPDGIYVSARLGTCWRDSDFEHELPIDPLPVPGRDWIVVLDGLVLA